MKRHYSRINGEVQKITVSVIGAGGTGSLFLQQLGRINKAMISLNQKGLHIRCYDHDIITESNIGRQLYTENDIGRNKAEAIISKINNYFGYDWESYDVKAGLDINLLSNFTVLCVDNVITRKHIYNCYDERTSFHSIREFEPYYIIDCGNTFNTGQIFLSTVQKIKQPESKFETVSILPNPIKEYGKNIYNTEDPNIPSCSLAEAISRQDILINQFMADFAAKMIWDLVRYGYIDYRAMFVNLEELSFQKKLL